MICCWAEENYVSAPHQRMSRWLALHTPPHWLNGFRSTNWCTNWRIDVIYASHCAAIKQHSISFDDLICSLQTSHEINSSHRAHTNCLLTSISPIAYSNAAALNKKPLAASFAVWIISFSFLFPPLMLKKTIYRSERQSCEEKKKFALEMHWFLWFAVLLELVWLGSHLS